ncbi:dCMP deaminase [Micromonospora sp. NBC_01796]|uniref:dCMP deaminase n=1 Tax=Micromonospora sp. NBC_01796 TaxID=2975987 RepID=UPI002DD7D0CB|nr:dCMP deaminase [Micromonospora sp. NBC_01796]WSA84752.1 dCMP deaminase [Micromonospora sp. NBC_01796]
MTQDDRRWLTAAIELSHHSPPVSFAYAVGAIVVDADGVRLADGFSRETDTHVHAEESALAKLAGVDLTGATIYSSLEPCSVRRSRPRTCTQLIIAAGLRRVAFALREPPLLADCHAVELLEEAGVEVVEIPDLADEVRTVNAHLLLPGQAR